MKRIAIAGLVLAAGFLGYGPGPAYAGSINGIVQVDVCDPTTNGGLNCLKPQADGSLNVNASASITGFPTSQSAGTPISVTSSSTTGTLPTGAVVVATNVGTTNGAYCKLGATATTSDQFIAPNGGWFAFTVGASTQLSCITSTSTTTVNMVGGSGLPTGTGGGGGSGASGAVTNAGTFAVQPAGSVAHDAVGTGVNPVLEGCYASAAAPTDVSADGDAVRAWCIRSGARAVYVTNNGVAQGAAISGQTPSTVAGQSLTANPTAYTTATTNPVTLDEYGAVLTRPYSLGAALVQGTTSAMTGTTSTSLVAAPGSGLRNYITNLTCVNSHATVGTFITVQDGSGGTALYTLAAAAVFGGAAITFPAPLRQPTTNTALYVADVTTGANVICSASGYKAP